MIIRWQDWLNVLLGCWLTVSPWEMEYSLNGSATANACGLGVTLVVFNVISACRLVDQGQEIFNILLGGWLILSPYAFNFATEKEPSTNVISVGIMVAILAAWQIYDAIKVKKG